MRGFAGRTKTSALLSWSGVAKSSFYYRCTTGKRGRKPSTHTRMRDGGQVSNDTVIIAIRYILAEEFVCYGYSKITDELRENGFVINYKKCYRLMKEQRLLCGRVIKAAGGSKRKFVNWRVQQATRPMEQLSHGHQVRTYPWPEPKCAAAYGVGRIHQKYRPSRCCGGR